MWLVVAGWQILPSGRWVEVKDFHTYYAPDIVIVVHNMCGMNSKKAVIYYFYDNEDTMIRQLDGLLI